MLWLHDWCFVFKFGLVHMHQSLSTCWVFGSEITGMEEIHKCGRWQRMIELLYTHQQRMGTHYSWSQQQLMFLTLRLHHFSKHVGFTVDLGCIFLHLKAFQFFFIFLETPLCATSCLFFLLIHRFIRLLSIFYVFLSKLFLHFFTVITNEIYSTLDFSTAPHNPRIYLDFYRSHISLNHVFFDCPLMSNSFTLLFPFYKKTVLLVVANICLSQGLTSVNIFLICCGVNIGKPMFWRVISIGAILLMDIGHNEGSGPLPRDFSLHWGHFQILLKLHAPGSGINFISQ